jgi:hypothetical protein
MAALVLQLLFHVECLRVAGFVTADFAADVTMSDDRGPPLRLG